MTNVQVERGYLTQSLGSASHSGEHGLKTVPGLLKLVLEKEAWKERIIVQTGEEFPGFKNFEAYLKANPPRGLGIEAETMDRLIGEDKELRASFYAALRKPHGGERRAESNGHTIKLLDSVPTTGTSVAYVLQKLNDEGKVDLLERVKVGELTPHAALKEAGFRRPKIAISLDDPQSAAKTILTHASPDFIGELKQLLNQESI